MVRLDPSESVFKPGQNCGTVARAERIALLVDASAYFDAFMRVTERARRSIMILAWDFDSGTPLRIGDQGRPEVALGSFLNRLARARRGLHIRVLDWDYPMIFGHDREFPPIYGLGWRPHRRVHFRFDDTHPLAGSHHQKLVVVDDCVASVGGLDLTTKRWDTPAHRPDDPRRLAGGSPYPPIHDTMVALDGDAATALARIARERWHSATGERLEPPYAQGDPWPESLVADFTSARVGIACTAPAYNGQSAVHHVERLHLDVIARAKRYIYIENQYFTSHKIAAALAARLAERDGPEIILVTRLLSHGWLEEMTTEVLRTTHIQALQRADSSGRFHVYYPHIAGLGEGTCIDVHSKLMIVDDEWLRVGSANLSNRSMGLDSECDVVIEAGGRPGVKDAIRKFRNRLLAEHLGREIDEVTRLVARHGQAAGAIEALGTADRRLAPLEVQSRSEGLVTTASLADLERPVSLDSFVKRFSPTSQDGSASPAWLKLVAGIAIIVALALAWRLTPLAELITPENVMDWARSFAGYWWAPLLIVLAYTPASIALFPRPLITLAAVVSFGPALGFCYAISGILIAATVGYYFGRSLGRDTIRRLAGERLSRLVRRMRKRGLVAMVAIRLVPLAPFIVESLVAGAIRLKLWHVILGTFIGMLPGVLTTTVLGNEIEAALRNPASINWGFIVAIVAAVATLMYAAHRWVARTEARGPGRDDR
jgi:phospholipase D1/2